MQGNAEKLPFGDNEFDIYTVAYGIRNMTHIDKVPDLFSFVDFRLYSYSIYYVNITNLINLYFFEKLFFILLYYMLF